MISENIQTLEEIQIDHSAIETVDGSGRLMVNPKKMPTPKYPLVAFRLPSEMHEKIAIVAKEDGISKSAVIKSAIEAYFKFRY